MSQNLIPAVWAEGSFEANSPFNTIVDPAVFYTVESVDTVQMLLAEKVDIWKLVLEPVGIAQDQAQTYIDQAITDEAVVIALTSRGNKPVYVLSTYMKSFPLVDGVILEHICIIADLGACPPGFKDRINAAVEHINNYIKTSIGIQNPRTTIGVVPTRAYISKEQSDAWEKTRQQAITENPSDLARNEKLVTENQQLYAYINELEERLKATNP